MFTLIENGDVYAPQRMGRSSVLMAGDSILRIGEVDVRGLERLEVPIEVPREGCFIDLDTAGEEDLSEYICLFFESDADPGHLTLSSDASQTSPSNLLEQIRRSLQGGCVDLERLLPLVTKNTATVLNSKTRASSHLEKRQTCWY